MSSLQQQQPAQPSLRSRPRSRRWLDLAAARRVGVVVLVADLVALAAARRVGVVARRDATATASAAEPRPLSAATSSISSLSSAATAAAPRPAAAAAPSPAAAALSRQDELDQRCKKTFAAIDKNKDGQLSKAELYKAVKDDPTVRSLLGLPASVAQGVGKEEFLAVFQAMDADGSDSVDYYEFRASFHKLMAQADEIAALHRNGPPKVDGPPLDPEQSAQCRALFKMIDTSKDGQLSKAELYKAMKENRQVREMMGVPEGLEPDELKERFEPIFNSMDSDNSNKIDYAEFASAFHRLTDEQAIKQQNRGRRGSATAAAAAGRSQAERRQRRRVGGTRRRPRVVKPSAHQAGLPAAEAARCRQIFQMMDKNGDGKLSQAEVVRACRGTRRCARSSAAEGHSQG